MFTGVMPIASVQTQAVLHQAREGQMFATNPDAGTDAIRHLPLDEDTLSACLEAWRSDHPQCAVLALLPEQEKERLPVLQSGCHDRGIPLSGAIFPALLVNGDFEQSGVLLLRLDTPPPAFLIPALNGGTATPEDRIADVLLPALERMDRAGGKPTLYMIFDSLLPNIASMVEGLYLRLADRVRYAGVNAGSETFQPMPCLFDGERVIDAGVLCLLMPADSVTVLEHGFVAPAHVMNATATEKNRIISIDWRPAFDVYQEIIKREYGIDLTRDNFYNYAVHFPFGIPRANEDVVVRIPVALTDDGSLYCVGEVPENTMLVLLRAPGAGEGHCISRLAGSLQSNNGTLSGHSILAFYCAGRRMHLGDDSRQELEDLKRSTGAGLIAGALSLGEIGSTGAWDYPMFHNAALVCTPWVTG